MKEVKTSNKSTLNTENKDGVSKFEHVQKLLDDSVYEEKKNDKRPNNYS